MLWIVDDVRHWVLENVGFSGIRWDQARNARKIRSSAGVPGRRDVNVFDTKLAENAPNQLRMVEPAKNLQTAFKNAPR